jgi:hypothetical protein
MAEDKLDSSFVGDRRRPKKYGSSVFYSFNVTFFYNCCHISVGMELPRIGGSLHSSTKLHLAHLLTSTKPKVCFLSEIRNASITKKCY